MINDTISDKTTQCKQILEYMDKHGSISSLEALVEFGCMRLSARIFDLRELGWNIRSIMTTHNGKKFARYILVESMASKAKRDEYEDKKAKLEHMKKELTDMENRYGFNEGGNNG